MEKAFSFIGQIVAYGGGAAALAYLVFMFLGKKWIETKFSERLEAYKHAQEIELEYYRHQVNVLFSRVTRIHEKEIEVLPEIWRKLQDALGYVAKINSFVTYSPNFRNMSDEEFLVFLKNSRFSETDKKALERSDDRNAFYVSKIFWYDLQDAKSAVSEFHNFMLYNRIFLSQDLKQAFLEIDTLLSSLLINREIGEEARDWKLITAASKELGEKTGKILERIEELVQNRLEFGKASSTIQKKSI